MNRLRMLREKMEVDQAYIARKMNVTQPMVSGWETGKHGIDSDTLIKLAELYDVSIDYILGYSGSRLRYDPDALDLLKLYLSEALNRSFTDDEIKAVDALVRELSKKN